jgi:hypothetical protein
MPRYVGEHEGGAREDCKAEGSVIGGVIAARSDLLRLREMSREERVGIWKIKDEFRAKEMDFVK